VSVREADTTWQLRLPALEVRQTRRRRLYTFAVDGKLLHKFAAVSRVKRDTDASLRGYQRPEVQSHIAGIRSYLESADPMLPNAMVVAFDRRVKFIASGDQEQRSRSRPGLLVVPVDNRWTEVEKPGWIVDGQQRAAAVREAAITKFPVCVTAFITDNQDEQREQFILVNSTRPLPKGLVYELLPATSGVLPRQYRVRRLPATLVERLNHDEDSPLRRLVQTPTTPEGVIKDNSLLRMIENSLSDGALYYLRSPMTGTGDNQPMLGMLKDFWQAVARVFPAAWGLPSRRSRLMHGVGVASMGFLMDAITERYLPKRFPTVNEYARELEGLAPQCRWTFGTWDFSSPRRWNEVQNTPRDIQLVADYLLSQYDKRVGHRLAIEADGFA